MKKVFSIVLAIVVCLSLVGVVMAAEGVFVPSITYKGQPGMGTFATPEGVEAPAAFVDAEGNITEYAGHSCVQVLPYSEASANEEMQKVYTELSDGTMKLPYEGEVVIRELLDVSLVCEDDHAAALQSKNLRIVLTFELGVEAEDVVVVYSYVDGEWIEAEVVNNGDGSVTVTFSALCPVAIALAV